MRTKAEAVRTQAVSPVSTLGGAGVASAGVAGAGGADAVPAGAAGAPEGGGAEAVAEGAGYLAHHAHRTAYPEYLAEGWCLGSGAVASACKTVVGQRLLSSPEGSAGDLGPPGGAHLLVSRLPPGRAAPQT